MPKGDENFLEFLKILQSGQIKTAMDELNQSVVGLRSSLAGLFPLMDGINKGVSESGVYLKEIAELHRSAQSLTVAMTGLTMAILALTSTQVFTPLVGAFPALVLGLFIALLAWGYLFKSRKQLSH